MVRYAFELARKRKKFGSNAPVGVVNPIPSIESIRLMLEHLGEEQAAKGIQEAVMKTLSSGEVRTADMGGTHKTHEMGNAVKNALLMGR